MTMAGLLDERGAVIVWRLVIGVTVWLLIVAALLGGGWAAYNHVAATAERSAQIFITSDERNPGQVHILLNVAAPLPFGRTYSDESMVCDGIELRYGQVNAPEPIGYFGAIPARAAGQSYRCVFNHWTGNAVFIVPALTTITPAFIAPVQGSHLSLSQPVAVTFATNAGTDIADEYMPDVWATDSTTHYTVADYSGLGPTGGSARFGPAEYHGFVPGLGTLILSHALRGVTVPVAGWSGVELIYQIGVSLPMVWI